VEEKLKNFCKKGEKRGRNLNGKGGGKRMMGVKSSVCSLISGKCLNSEMEGEKNWDCLNRKGRSGDVSQKGEPGK